MLPRIIAAIGGVIITSMGSVFGRLLIALGLSVVTYTGLSTSLDWLKDQMLESLNNVPEQIVTLLAYMKVGTCINIIITAITVRLSMKGVSGGSVKKWVLKK